MPLPNGKWIPVTMQVGANSNQSTAPNCVAINVDVTGAKGNTEIHEMVSSGVGPGSRRMTPASTELFPARWTMPANAAAEDKRENASMADQEPVSVDAVQIGTALILRHILRVLERSGLTNEKETESALDGFLANLDPGHASFLQAIKQTYSIHHRMNFSVIEGGKQDPDDA
ncbi:hypothetical protein [Methylobacterium sp. WSM2598]|uniref:hypothetical protein n=1 Tax=Methylobacterium sp. WSM2598 TaxID=398261 RepID=UPI0012F6F091|nr:hypothetical protein [Methylobacterium sp. WSM2598]